MIGVIGVLSRCHPQPTRMGYSANRVNAVTYFIGETMLLENKIAVIYGAGGAMGGAVAKAFAREAARVFLTGRNINKVAAVAKEIIAPAERLNRLRSTL